MGLIQKKFSAPPPPPPASHLPEKIKPAAAQDSSGMLCLGFIISLQTKSYVLSLCARLYYYHATCNQCPLASLFPLHYNVFYYLFYYLFY